MYNNKRMIGKAHYDVATVDRLVKMEMGWLFFDRNYVNRQSNKEIM